MMAVISPSQRACASAVLTVEAADVPSRQGISPILAMRSSVVASAAARVCGGAPASHAQALKHVQFGPPSTRASRRGPLIVNRQLLPVTFSPRRRRGVFQDPGPLVSEVRVGATRIFQRTGYVVTPRCGGDRIMVALPKPMYPNTHGHITIITTIIQSHAVVISCCCMMRPVILM